MTDELAPLFTWRSAVCESDLHPNIRHVAMVLSLHMSELASTAMPGHATLARQTGRGRTTVRNALRSLIEKGWLVAQQPFVHSRGIKNIYQATIPEQAERRGPAQTPSEAKKGSGPGPFSDKGSGPDPFSGDASEPTPLLLKDLKSKSQTKPLSRALPTDQLSLGAEIQNNPAPTPDCSFDQFWARYPPRNFRKLLKSQAKTIWDRMAAADHAAALAAVGHYAEYCVTWDTLAQDAVRWLRDRRWEEFAEPATGPPAPKPRGGGHQPWRAPDPERYRDRRIG